MSETASPKTDTAGTNSAKQVKHKKRKPKQGHGLLKFLTLLLIIGLVGFGVWRYGLKSWNDYRNRITGLEAVVTALQEAQKREREDTDKQLSALTERHTHLEEGVSSLLETSGHTRKDWLLAEAEYLIKLASHRLLLDRDIRTAIVALQAANTRLGEIGHPGVIKVRKQISKDIRELQKLPMQDTSGISLTISTLLQDIEKLPLRTPDPADIRERIKEQQAESKQAKDLPDVANLIWQDLKSLVNYRKHDQPIQPLLQPEQRFFLIQNLQLKLEQARLALLRTEYTIYQERLQEAQKWLKQYFDSEHSSTKSAAETLNTLLKQDVMLDLPELSNSYTALKRFRDSGAVKSRRPKQNKPKKPATKPKPKPKQPTPPATVPEKEQSEKPPAAAEKVEL